MFDDLTKPLERAMKPHSEPRAFFTMADRMN